MSKHRITRRHYTASDTETVQRALDNAQEAYDAIVGTVETLNGQVKKFHRNLHAALIDLEQVPEFDAAEYIESMPVEFGMDAIELIVAMLQQSAQELQLDGIDLTNLI